MTIAIPMRKPPGVRYTLGWFEARLAPSGLLGKPKRWDFVNWTKDFEDGVRPQEADGQSFILSLQFAAALGEAADLEADFGPPRRAERAEHFRALASMIVEAVRRTCWDSSHHLIADTPARKHFSQHGNILAVLAGGIISFLPWDASHSSRCRLRLRTKASSACSEECCGV